MGPPGRCPTPPPWPETTTHSAAAFASGDELSPEEQAMSGLEVPVGAGDGKEFADEDTDTAALADMVKQVVVDKKDASEVAKTWLASAGLA